MRQRKKAARPRKPKVAGKVRKPKAPRVPKTRAGGTMTESAFFSFLRSALRQKSRRWAPIYMCLQDARRPSKSPNKRLRWEYQCALCEEWKAQKDVSVDHVIACGSLRSFDDLPGFASRLFVEKEGLRVLCNPCHQGVTNKEREQK